ncbi:Hsp70 protein [Lentzea xinjiangensis]|uniref:Hsp70 protein n=1 Tax=Lentzea xinjiangensis TaxID=402600 RepID=A0A1H9G9G9_9PSEU|nr:Hsp70 family protein [Lentzea xinjiangensis]SEQ46663.1 Hsp70 protein [Lentzea xinjiangensis]
MSYHVGLDLGSAGSTAATARGVTTSSRRRRHSTARELVDVCEDLAARHGEPPGRVALTHPLSWSHEQLDQLRAELIEAGRADVVFVPAPHAAAIAFDADARMPEHGTVAVVDFGATGCEVAVLRKQGVFLPAGWAERVDGGGFHLDDLVAEHVIDRIRTHSPELVRSCVEAKELLGSYPEVRIPYIATSGEAREFRLSRLRFEAIIRPVVEHAVDALERVVSGAGLPDVVLLVGGSARIPLVAREISARLGIPVLRAPDGAAATGALLEAEQLEPRSAGEPTVQVPLPREQGEEPKRRLPATPFVAAGMLVVALAAGWAAHEAVNRPQVVMEPASVELRPPGTAELPRLTG